MLNKGLKEGYNDVTGASTKKESEELAIMKERRKKNRKEEETTIGRNSGFTENVFLAGKRYKPDDDKKVVS